MVHAIHNLLCSLPCLLECLFDFPCRIAANISYSMSPLLRKVLCTALSLKSLTLHCDTSADLTADFHLACFPALTSLHFTGNSTVRLDNIVRSGQRMSLANCIAEIYVTMGASWENSADGAWFMSISLIRACQSSKRLQAVTMSTLVDEPAALLEDMVG
ncbi:hypothetical protein FB451DRAFT_1164072 [Mycena latifolia]|nr:hypothetical protein FB451DRAFT_1164072 [Mycena latifolia]